MSDKLTDSTDEMSWENDDMNMASPVSGEQAVVDTGQSDEEELDEAEEILPAEFLENTETFSSVLPRCDMDEDEMLGSDTVLMSPSEVRRLATRATNTSSSNRRAGGSSVASRRSRRNEEEELSPEEILRRRRNDMKAKFFIYFVIVVLGLAFVGLLTYKLPALFKDSFPNGVWPWSEICEVYTGKPFNWFDLFD